jgi:hypothetical protein
LWQKNDELNREAKKMKRKDAEGAKIRKEK